MKTQILVLLAASILFPAGAAAQSEPTAWKQVELTEPFMRSLTKDQCMAKTVASLKAGCSTEECLKTLAGITGDCVTWARGDVATFCASYDRNYLARYCATNELDARRCIVLHSGKPVHCKSTDGSSK